MAFREREFPFQKRQKTALHLACVYCEGERITAVLSHSLSGFQFSTANSVSLLSSTFPAWPCSPIPYPQIQDGDLLTSAISTYTQNSYKQPNNSQALQLLVNYSWSVTAKPPERLSGLSLQDHRSTVMYNSDKRFPLLNVTSLSYSSSLGSWHINQKISLKKEVSMFTVKGTVLNFLVLIIFWTL